jgi:hypothetical protein
MAIKSQPKLPTMCCGFFATVFLLFFCDHLLDFGLILELAQDHVIKNINGHDHQKPYAYPGQQINADHLYNFHSGQGCHNTAAQGTQGQQQSFYFQVHIKFSFLCVIVANEEILVNQKKNPALGRVFTVIQNILYK